MRIVDSHGDSTVEQSQRGIPTGGQLGIVVFGRRDARVHWLREGETVVVGRSIPADIVLSDKSLSRQHARLTVDGRTVLLTDLGSRNGVTVLGARVAEARLRIGDRAQLGGVTLVVQSAQAAAPIAPFETLLAEAHRSTSSADSARRPIAFILLRCGDEHRGEIGALLRPTDCAAVYGPSTLAVLLRDANETHARDWLAGVAPRVAFALRAGIAVFPEIAGSDALLAAARAALERATAREPVVFASPAHRGAKGDTCADHDDPIVHGQHTQQVFALARRVARSDLPVLVLGETGTGKEVLVHAIQASSPRARRAFRVVNCGALPPSLMESVLFGHEKGAFTGAAEAHAGLFEQAHGGALFLDEIAELSPAAQVALLRVLETKTLTRLGARSERNVDVRVLAATHRDLQALCAEGRFREDLMHRLNAVTLVLPPLRDRRDEIPTLVERFLRGRHLPADSAREIAPAALALLCAHDWPGNVRQLKNVIERAAVLALGATIEVDDLPEDLRAPGREPRLPALDTLQPPQESVETGEQFRHRLQNYEADLVRRALAEAGGNKTQAARLLRMPLRTFMKRIGEYGIE